MQSASTPTPTADVVAAAEAITAAAACNDPGCREAYSSHDTCRCGCNGGGHGLQWRHEAASGKGKMRARLQRAGGDPFALLPAVDDEAW